MTKNAQSPYKRLEQILVVAGIAAIGLATIANLFGAWNNRSFISDPLDVIYYYRYIILLGGGFAIGYALSRLRQPKKQPGSALFYGIASGLLVFILADLLDVLRILIVNPLFTPSYPWGKFIFIGTTLIALLLLIIISFFTSRKAPTANRSFIAIVISTFILGQASIIALGFVQSSDALITEQSVWILLLGIVTAPLFIAVASYSLLNNIKEFSLRAFYATIIAALYSVILMTTWEFRTNPEAGATETFGLIVTVFSFASVAIILLCARKTRNN
jgi:hypothetical protein